MRWRLALNLLLAGAAIGGWWSAWRAHQEREVDTAFQMRRAALREQENGRLTTLLAQRQQDQERASDAQQRELIEKSVVSLRELPFLRPVVYREIPRSDLPAILQQKLVQQMPDREFEASGVALTALGLIPPGTDLKKTYLALLGEQIGAFYDQHTREVFTFSGQPLAAAQNRVILAHELTHALEDQHFHLENLPLETKGNDDRALAASALVEGDATLVMNRFMLGQMSGAVLKESLASALTTDVRQLAAAPRFLRETLLFPYLKGQAFCEELYARGGWPALAEAFRRPPSSTAEVLHPERFLKTPRWEPTPVALQGTVVDGQAPLADNVVGEFVVGQLLRLWRQDAGHIRLAAEWEGDRYLVFGDTRMNSLVWRSVWSSDEAAKRFAAAAKQGFENRYKTALTTTPAREIWSAQLPDRHEVRVCLNGRSVALIDAQDTGWAEKLARLLPSEDRSIFESHE